MKLQRDCDHERPATGYYEVRVRSKPLMYWLVKKLVGKCYEEHIIENIDSIDIKLKLNRKKK